MKLVISRRCWISSSHCMMAIEMKFSSTRKFAFRDLTT
ncbi:hypothetical protein NBEOAGPD_2263 [Methylobacterium gregans]|uniref:Uncharacterized protein n=1 Tax=Methylobacterium gregans TaxID=374424 RepID=A0AA37HNM9_9HYPH|nr:hypothetical protein [Methylobacterium gregans]GJD79043.1 hypothetical protein NBEOAGPD_2263 [Methylobacterium gregans]